MMRIVVFLFFGLKVVAIVVFLALGFAFYVFFAPFVEKKIYQYNVTGLYTPLVNQFLAFILFLIMRSVIVSF
jgi:hypothetical protein